MTTAPVMSITDELIAELEQRCRSIFPLEVNREAILALLAERAELKKDAERLDWLISDEAIVVELKQMQRYHVAWPALAESQSDCFMSPREAIDAAMQAAQ